MKRRMLGLRDKLCNEDIRRSTRITDVLEIIGHLKWQWLGYWMDKTQTPKMETPGRVKEV